MCGNEGCGMVVNKREKEKHEKNICEFRIAMCHHCTEIKASQSEIKASQEKWNVRQSFNLLKIFTKQYSKEWNRTKWNGTKKMEQIQWIRIDYNRKELLVLTIVLYNQQNEMKVEITKMKDKISAIERKQDETKVGQYVLKSLD